MRWLLGTILALVLSLHSVPAQAECLKNFCLDSNGRGKFCASNLRGKYYLIDFWATWCPGCVQSLDWLSRIEKDFPRGRFGFLALNLDANPNDAKVFINQHRLRTEVAFDPQGSQAEACGLTGVPASILIDSKGNILRRWNGFSASVQTQIMTELERLKREK